MPSSTPIARALALPTLWAGLLAACTAANPSYLSSEGGAGDHGPPEPSVAAGDGQVVDSGRPATPAGVDLRTGLEGFWQLDEGPGGTTARDSSGRGNHGTLVGLDAARAWVPGRWGLALENGNDKIVAGARVPASAALDRLTRYTLAAWIYRPANQPGYGCLISRQIDDLDGEVFNLCVVDGRLRAYYPPSSSGLSNNVKAPAALPVGRWVHVAASYDGARLRLYQDGLEVERAPMNEALPRTAQPLYLGTNVNAGGDPDSFVGLIDELALYTLALPQSAIAALAAGSEP